MYFFLRLYEVCAKALRNASALPAIHAMFVNFVSFLTVASYFSPPPFFNVFIVVIQNVLTFTWNSM